MYLCFDDDSIQEYSWLTIVYIRALRMTVDLTRNAVGGPASVSYPNMDVENLVKIQVIYC